MDNLKLVFTNCFTKESRKQGEFSMVMKNWELALQTFVNQQVNWLLGDVPTKMYLKKSFDRIFTLFQPWRIKPMRHGWQQKTSLHFPIKQ